MPKGELIFSLTAGDFELQTFRSGGKGGQHQNKTESGVRWIHHPSGARGESREERSQYQNKRKALKKLADSNTFRYWVHQYVKKLDGFPDPEKWVEEEMNKLENFKFEVKDENGKWIEVA